MVFLSQLDILVRACRDNLSHGMFIRWWYDGPPDQELSVLKTALPFLDAGPGAQAQAIFDRRIYVLCGKIELTALQKQMRVPVYLPFTGERGPTIPGLQVEVVTCDPDGLL